MFRNAIFPVAALTAAMLSLPAAAQAQDTGSFAVLGGISQYDLSGTGTTAVVSLRGTSSLSRPVVIEAALGYMPYFTQGEEQRNHVFPEAQVQLQWLGSPVRPYVGAGIGGSHAWSPGVSGSLTDLTVSGAGGVRWAVVPGWALQGELRVRAVDPWTGTTADWGLGVVGRF